MLIRLAFLNSVLLAFSFAMPGLASEIDRGAIKIDVLPMSVSQKHYETDIALSDSSKRPPARDCGRTDWVFDCQPDFKYDIEKQSSKGEPSNTTLKITAVKITLTLAITVWTSVKADARTKAHEAGHVEICTRVYANAEKAASEAAQKVIGKRFSDQSTDHTLAVAKSLVTAKNMVCSSYRAHTVDIVSAVSRTYDRIELYRKRSPTPPADSVDQAFATAKVPYCSSAK